MKIKECYEQIGADYNAILNRLGNEELVKKFALKFLSDNSFSKLKEALQSGNGEDAFRTAHTLKGVCLNLGLDNLYKVSAELTEKLRGRELVGTEELFSMVEEEYQKTVTAIQKVEE